MALCSRLICFNIYRLCSSKKTLENSRYIVNQTKQCHTTQDSQINRVKFLLFTFKIVQRHRCLSLTVARDMRTIFL